MVNYKIFDFDLLEIQAHFLLWSAGVLNIIQIMLYAILVDFFNYKRSDFNYPAPLWNLLALSFYLAWSTFGMLSSFAGIHGIKKNEPIFLRKCAVYLWCSTIGKIIFAAILFIFPTSSNELNVAITYASNELFLILLIGKFTDAYAPTPTILSHLVMIVVLVYSAIIVQWYRNVMLRKSKDIKACEEHLEV